MPLESFFKTITLVDFFYMKMIFVEQDTCNRALNFSTDNILKSLVLISEEEKVESRLSAIANNCRLLHHRDVVKVQPSFNFLHA